MPLLHVYASAASFQKLARRGLLRGGARRIAHHFSHNGTLPYDELVDLLAPEGIEPSYDGMAVTL